jgi:hypothetical protein
VGGTIRATSRPRRVITTSSPDETRSSSSRNCSRASRTDTRVIETPSCVHLYCTPDKITTQAGKVSSWAGGTGSPKEGRISPPPPWQAKDHTHLCPERPLRGRR